MYQVQYNKTGVPGTVTADQRGSQFQGQSIAIGVTPLDVSCSSLLLLGS